MAVVMGDGDSSTVWQLGAWQVMPAINRLQNEQLQRVLEPRVMAALQVIMQADGAVVSDEQLLAGVWRGQIVSDASLYKVIADLRKALGDTDKPYQYIERVSSKGYRLLIAPKPVPDKIAQEPISAPQHPVTAISNITEPEWQSTDYEDAIKPGFGLDGFRTKLSGAKSPIWLWLFVLIFIVISLWQLLPGTTQAPTPPRVNTQPLIQADSKPDTISQAAWDSFLEARWLATRRKPADIAQAIPILQHLIRETPTFALAEVELCNSYHALHAYSDWPLSKVMALCEPLLRHALQLDASSAAALATFGLLKASQNDPKAAAVFLDKSLTIAPDNATALKWRAQLYRQEGRLDKALPLIERANQIDPLSGPIKRELAFTLINSGNVGQARRLFQESLLLDPDYSDRAIDELDMLPLTIDRARAFSSWAKKFPDRIEDAGNPGPAINLALIHLSLGQINAADAALKIAEAKYPFHQFTLLARAMYADANNDPHAARLALTQRAALQPNNPMYAVINLIYGSDNPQTKHEEFLALFPEFKNSSNQIVRNYLRDGKGQLVMLWLLTQSANDREKHADVINEWLARQSEPDNLSVNLHLLLGQTEQANALALSMLRNGWLPSPNDDFYLAEKHPLWKQLNSAVFSSIDVNRRNTVIE